MFWWKSHISCWFIHGGQISEPTARQICKQYRIQNHVRYCSALSQSNLARVEEISPPCLLPTTDWSYCWISAPWRFSQVPINEWWTERGLGGVKWTSNKLIGKILLLYNEDMMASGSSVNSFNLLTEFHISLSHCQLHGSKDTTLKLIKNSLLMMDFEDGNSSLSIYTYIIK